jgi:hypothetical protein
MASISKRFTASGQARYDVRYRAGGRAVEETFKRRQDAENRVRQIEADKLRGQVVDPRGGREKLADFAERWLEVRTVKGKPLAPMTKQGYRSLMARIGHASPRAALIYQHATEQRDREIAAYLDDAISEP